jgi:hypothetical protein
MTETSCRAVHDPARVLGSRSLQCGREKDRLANGRHVIIRSAPSFLYTNVCYCEHLHVSARLGRPSGHMVQTTAEMYWCANRRCPTQRQTSGAFTWRTSRQPSVRRSFRSDLGLLGGGPCFRGEGRERSEQKDARAPPSICAILTVRACRAFEGRPSEELQHPAADAERHSTLVLPAS